MWVGDLNRIIGSIEQLTTPALSLHIQPKSRRCVSILSTLFPTVLFITYCPRILDYPTVLWATHRLGAIVTCVLFSCYFPYHLLTAQPIRLAGLTPVTLTKNSPISSLRQKPALSSLTRIHCKSPSWRHGMRAFHRTTSFHSIPFMDPGRASLPPTCMN